MGKIRTHDIKDSAWKLYKNMPKLFSKNFDDNKTAIKPFVPRKSSRNKIAGYLVRIVRQQDVE